MTSYPPPGGDPQRGPEDEGQPHGGSPQEPGQQPYPQQPPYPQQGGYPPPGQQPYPQNPQNPQYGQNPYPGQYPQYGQNPPYPPDPQSGQNPEYGQPQYPQYPPYGQNPPAGYGSYPPPGAPPPGGAYGGGFVDPQDPLVATSFDQWLSKSLAVFTRSWQPLLLIQLAAYVPAVVIGGLLALLGALTGSIALVIVLAVVSFVVLIAGVLIAQGVSVYYVAHDAAGQRVTVQDAFRFGVGRAPALLGWGILAAILIFVGFLLLIVPGIYLALVFTAALTGVIMFERGAIDRCFSLFNRRFGATLGRVLLYVVAAIVYQLLVQAVVLGALGADSTLGSIIVQILAIPVSLVAVGVSVVTYAELRYWEAPGQVTTQRLVAELHQ